MRRGASRKDGPEKHPAETMVIELYCEISKRFPEMPIPPGDEELPTMLMYDMVEWLKSFPTLPPGMVARIKDFCRWCEAYPRGKTAEDDLNTVLVVSFYEHLFESPTLRGLLPQLRTERQVRGNAAYLRQWVGGGNYEAALKHYGRKGKR